MRARSASLAASYTATVSIPAATAASTPGERILESEALARPHAEHSHSLYIRFGIGLFIDDVVGRAYVNKMRVDIGLTDDIAVGRTIYVHIAPPRCRDDGKRIPRSFQSPHDRIGVRLVIHFVFQQIPRQFVPLVADFLGRLRPAVPALLSTRCKRDTDRAGGGNAAARRPAPAAFRPDRPCRRRRAAAAYPSPSIYPSNRRACRPNRTARPFSR